MSTCASFYLGLMVMIQTTGAITVEPGKQLPQSIVVRAATDDDYREQTVHYLLFAPREYQASKEKWSLLLFLHGLGECGDNELERVKIHGPAKLVESQPDFPFVVVTPQCLTPPGGMKDVPTAWRSEPLIQLVDHVVANLQIDPTRVYVTGLSMGGYGTWRLAANYPDKFAAALPICGGGEPRVMAGALRCMPIWAFHGARDPVVPLAASQEMVDAVRAAGGDVRLTIYPEVAHDSWTQTYNNQDVFDWLLAHQKETK